VREGLLAGSLEAGDFRFRGPGGFLIFGALDAAALLPSALSHPRGWGGLRADLDANLSQLILLHRTWSALAGIATVLMLARLVRRQLGLSAGIIAATFTAACYLHVRESHFGTIDTLFGLAFVCTLDALLDLAHDGTRRSSLRAGLWAGIATAIKYFGGVLVLHLLLAHAWSRHAARTRGATPPPWSAVAWTGAAMLAGFLLLSPSIVVQPMELFDAVVASVSGYGARPTGVSLAELPSYHALTSTWIGWGAAPTVLAACGLAWGLWRAGPLRLPALFALLTLPCVLALHLPAVRYALPWLLALAPLAAGCAGAWLAPLLSRRGVVPRVVAVAAVLACVLPGTLRSAAFGERVGRTDTRLLMLDRLAELGVPSSEVWAFGLYGLPRSAGSAPAPYVDVYREVARQPDFLARAEADPPRYVLRDPGAQDLSAWTGLDLDALLARRYRRSVQFDPRAPPGSLPLGALSDAGTPQHFLSFTQPAAVDRPGPVLELFELRAD